jgi:hypothetical protein
MVIVPRAPPLLLDHPESQQTEDEQSGHRIVERSSSTYRTTNDAESNDNESDRLCGFRSHFFLCSRCHLAQRAFCASAIRLRADADIFRPTGASRVVRAEIAVVIRAIRSLMLSRSFWSADRTGAKFIIPPFIVAAQTLWDYPKNRLAIQHCGVHR